MINKNFICLLFNNSPQLTLYKQRGKNNHYFYCTNDFFIFL